MSKKRYCCLAIAVQAGLMLGAVSNTAKIDASGAVMVIAGNGTGANHVIAWDNFNSGKDADVNFKGDRKNFLPKATGSSLPEVFGRLNGEGKNLCPVNPKGIICGEDARINVGSIYASTRNINKTYLRAFESSSVLIGKITASQLCQADCPGGNQRWLEVKQQRKGGHFFGTRGKSGRIDSQ